LKLLVTLQDTDFAFLQQGAVRIDATHPLQQLAQLYHSGESSRSSAAGKVTSPEMDWATVTVVVGIGRQ
jgi:hypothetical protein